ncbi:MAG: hypothetical protein P4M07_09985 [Xanthobacteraceae bacterium]|nr:hypothetical protein [Xanthobacteraceae bacterium]
MDDQQDDAGPRGPAAGMKKAAVVVIHGMGEQRPMDTIWKFVDAAWIYDPEMVSKRTDTVFSKPDKITGSFELRRITTRHSRGHGPRVDFFEFYWAHLMTGNTVSSFVQWLIGLVVRTPSSVPRRLVAPWLIGLAVLVASLAVAVLAGLPESLRPGFLPRAIWPAALALSALGGLFSAWWLAPVAGDAARYLSPTPNNVAARQAIREAGIDLLTKLHGSGDYDRIIVVGHSLGTVVGYDVLNCLWGRIDKEAFWTTHRQTPEAMKALDALERATKALIEAPAENCGPQRLAYRAAQRGYFAVLATLRTQDKPLWLVSDFVTLGSPMSKADVLMARDRPELERKKALRDLPSCPPWLEKKDPPRFSFYLRDPVRAPHHAAVFAPTVWTNIFFDSKAVVFGDVIAGPLAPLFGSGICDVRVPIGGLRFRHLDYWKDPQGTPPAVWIRALRRAINLRGHDDATLWAPEADRGVVRAERLPEAIATTRMA